MEWPLLLKGRGTDGYISSKEIKRYSSHQCRLVDHALRAPHSHDCSQSTQTPHLANPSYRIGIEPIPHLIMKR